MARHRTVLVLLALAVGGVAACSDEPDGLPPGAEDPGFNQPDGLDALPVDPGYATCALVTAEMVNRNLGLELPEGRARDDVDDPRSCQFGDYSFDGTGDVLVSVYVAESEEQAGAIFDDVVFIVSARAVDGIGDEAAAAPFSSRFVVRQGNVVVDVYGESGQARLGAEDLELQALALEILGASGTLPGAETGATPAAP